MKLEESKGHWALVTGASSGIGREFCLQLAAAGMNLVLVARREQPLQTLAQELSARHSVQSLALAVDLSRTEAAAETQSLVAGKGLKIRLLVNNGAFGHWGRFEMTPPEVYQDLIQFNTVTLVSLCHRFLPDLTSFASSVIINVSTPAAFQPVPYMAVYAATRAFVYSFSQALYGEWKERGVLVQTLIPGPTPEEFDAAAGTIYESTRTQLDSPEYVVKTSLTHLADDAPLVVTAKGTYKQRFFAGLFPARLVIREVGRMFQPPDKTRE